MLISARVSLPRAGRLVAAALVAVALMTGGAPAAMAMSAPAASAAPPEPTGDNPPGADTSATTPSGAPSAVPPEEAAVSVPPAQSGRAAEPTNVSDAPARPRFAMALAVGISVDNHGISDGRNVLVPSLAVQAGIGEGLFGFGLRLFASEAAGRYSSLSPAGKPVSDLGADRQALDVLLNVRPFVPAWTDAGEAWTARFVRALALDLGVAAERVSLGSKSIFREGVVAGAHVSIPVVRSADGSELLVTLVVRRMVAARQTVDVGGTPQSIGDSKLEAFSGLTVTF